MNRKIILFTLGQMLKILSLLMVLPAIVSLLYHETSFWSFLATSVIAAGLGFLFAKLFRTDDQTIFAREGFAIVALTWLLSSAVGALPFTLSGEIPRYVDAFFECVSGLTTTGASVLVNVERLSHGILFWRSFTHWIGGMGILVLIVALLPSSGGRTMHILRAEMPGPVVGKLVPRARETAKILYIIYIVMTAVEVIFLLCGGMSLFDSLVHAFGTAGTGGFSIKADGLAGYSPFCQWVIAIFMLLFGVNFNLYYLVLRRRFKTVLKSGELWCYLSIVLGACAIIVLDVRRYFPDFGDAFRTAAFQVSSIITTTGYSTVDFNLWPTLSKSILLLLMFIGGCAGSTAGGFKVSRVMLVFKTIRRDLGQLLHPRTVSVVRLEGRRVEDATIQSLFTYSALYVLALLVTFVVLSIEPFSIETNFTAAVACFNNIGPGFGMVGPAANYAAYTPLSKVVLSLAMLFGRLEIFPMLLVFSPALWRKN